MHQSAQSVRIWTLLIWKISSFSCYITVLLNLLEKNKTYNTDVYVGVLYDCHTSLCVVLSPGNRRPRGTVSGFLRCLTALTTWTQCHAPPPSTAADWVAIRRGPSHCGEQQDPAQSATVSEIVTLSLPYITNTQYFNLQRADNLGPF